MTDNHLRIALVSTRLAGTDGVSLESGKWTDVLTEMGHTCFYFAGECDRPAERSRVVPEAHFDHPDIARINTDLFDDEQRRPETSEAVRDLWGRLKRELLAFVRDFDIQLLLIENALAIPMNVPLGLAVTELVAETNIPTIAHHHDFAWERTRFVLGAAEDYLQAAFPPSMSNMHHVVINSFAAKQFALRTGLSSTLIPNVMDFDHPPTDHDPYRDDLCERLGIAADEKFLLQPTRIVPRKRIERAIELARWLDMPCKLVVSHSAGDEGYEYKQYLADYARAMGVELIFGDEVFEYDRRRTASGSKIYSLHDAYQCADLVTYPSQIEGFGNAFLEAIYYRKPLMVSSYEIFRTDIQPKGFQVVSFGEFLTADTVAHARRVLDDSRVAREMVDHNYELGRRHYSYSVLREHLGWLIRQTRRREHSP